MEENKETKGKTVKPRKQLKLKQYFMKGLSTFLVVLACIACYFAFLRIDDIAALLGKIGGILQPIFLGFAFAYMLNPLVTKIEKYLNPILSKNAKNEMKVKRFSRTIAIVTSLLISFAVVVLLLNMVIPELYRSIRDLVLSLPEQVNEAIDYLEKQRLDDSMLSETIAAIIESGADNFQEMVTDGFVKTGKSDDDLVDGWCHQCI